MIDTNYNLTGYDAAGQYADKVHALALVEHFGHSITVDCAYGRCPYGTNDGGRAFGLLQQHPSFICEYWRTSYGTPAFQITVSDDQPTAQIKAVAIFFDCWEHLGLDLCVMAYNLGVTAVLKGARNPTYLQRFSDALNRVRALGNVH